ncbi:FimB/Mfa2 family fimbrial subunit [Butyricimonas sp. Marseille-P3923]|uniref:FimB/Mfa2 family fimbrial subunit n=1 Tax=Butyricimonas sp. Marseille-P3923 TaxID=1987504 RepID=UPI000C07B23B|nr:FimB/Mfa2 family fimbrial subunit [Butyricimonas sp. Marseille-P3923]
MKRILYTLIVLSTVLFTGCREDQLEGEGPGKEVALTFSSRSSDLSADALSKEITGLHLLIFNEDGTFSQQKEYDGLANVTPVKLPLGTYTFAYLSNIDKQQISGLAEGAKLDDIVVTLQADANGDIILPGSIFSGTDKITVGEDKTSDVALSRMVGRLDINVSGLKGGVELQSVTLLGSPKSVSFNGTPKDTKAQLKVPMSKDGELMKGQAIAFPTCVDSLARLKFVIVEDGEIKTYVSALKNKVEANKIHTINAKVNVVGGVFDVAIEMSLEEWGASESEDITAIQKIYLDSLTVKFLVENGSTVNFNRVHHLMADIVDGKGEHVYSLHANKYDSYNSLYVSKDTLIVKCRDRVLAGNYTLQNISLRDSVDNNLYALPAPVKNVVLDTTGNVVVVLPKMPDVADTDIAAMLELRDAMRAAGLSVSNWNGDNINLWYDVETDAAGRVVRIGYSQLEDYGNDDDYDHGGVAKSAKIAKTSNGISRNGTLAVWNLPESLKNLTELNCFTIGESSYGCLAEIPAFIKDMGKLEEFSVYTNATTLPELPVSLKLLEVCSESLTTIPSHIANLVNLQVLIFEVPYEDDGKDEDIDLSKSAISSVDVEFSKLTNLKYLFIQAGTNCTFPNALWNMTGESLTGLGLAGFSGIEIPSTVTRWTSLRELALANDNLIPTNIQAIKDLRLEDLTIYSPVFAQNGLPDWLGQMSTLEYLTLTNCGLTTIPDSFNGLTNLEDLDLSKNPNLTGKLPSVLLERYINRTLYVYAEASPNFSPDGIILVVTPRDIYASGEGQMFDLEIKADGAWSCQLDIYHDNFVTLAHGADSVKYNAGVLKGEGDASLTVRVKPGLFGEHNSRHGNIIVQSGTRSVYVPIYQESATVEKLEVESGYSYKVAAGDSFTFEILSNTDWYIETECIGGDGILDMGPADGTGGAWTKGELVMPEGVSSCEILVRLRSRNSDLERTITVNGYRN